MPVETTDEYVRIRQREPEEFEEGSMRTIDIDEDKGIKAVAGKIKGEDSMTVQSYLFALDKGWTESKAKAWVKKHGGKAKRIMADTPAVRATVRCERDEAMVEIADDAEVPPREFLIMPRPVFETSKGAYIVDDEACASIMADFARRGVDLLIDYEHQTLNAEHNGQPAPAWGWFRPEVRDDGIYAVVSRWATEAVEALQARKYRYHSPVFTYDKETRRVQSIEMESLVNYPASFNQVPLAAKADPIDVAAAKAAKEMVMLKAILETLGVKDESEAGPAIVALKAERDERSTEIGSLKAEVEKARAESETASKILADVCECVGTTDRGALVGACKALSERAATVETLAKELDTMKAERDAREKANIIGSLKVPAKTAEWLSARDLATVVSFRDTLGSETQVVHTDAQSASAITTPPSIGGDGAEREAMYREWRRMGFAEDKLPARWEKYLSFKMGGK